MPRRSQRDHLARSPRRSRPATILLVECVRRILETAPRASRSPALVTLCALVFGGFSPSPRGTSFTLELQPDASCIASPEVGLVTDLEVVLFEDPGGEQLDEWTLPFSIGGSAPLGSV